MTKAVGSSDPYGGGVAAVGTNRIAVSFTRECEAKKKEADESSETAMD